MAQSSNANLDTPYASLWVVGLMAGLRALAKKRRTVVGSPARRQRQTSRSRSRWPAPRGGNPPSISRRCRARRCTSIRAAGTFRTANSGAAPRQPVGCPARREDPIHHRPCKRSDPTGRADDLQRGARENPTRRPTLPELEGDPAAGPLTRRPSRSRGARRRERETRTASSVCSSAPPRRFEFFPRRPVAQTQSR